MTLHVRKLTQSNKGWGVPSTASTFAFKILVGSVDSKPLRNKYNYKGWVYVCARYFFSCSKQAVTTYCPQMFAGRADGIALSRTLKRWAVSKGTLIVSAGAR